MDFLFWSLLWNCGNFQVNFRKNLGFNKTSFAKRGTQNSVENDFFSPQQTFSHSDFNGNHIFPSLLFFESSIFSGSINSKWKLKSVRKCIDWKSSISWIQTGYRFNWGSYNISIAKTASKKIGALIRFGALIRSGKFLSPKFPLYKSTMEYLCHVWAGAPIYYLELLEIL